jgi:ABC-type polysaccharide/polyol phosphate transport system ATPase subunit
MTPAIRIRGVGKYIGPPVETDGVARPREAWRALLRIAGIELAPDPADPQVTVGVPGHVLRDVSIDIMPGTVTCLAGISGSGKSVLLQILAGVLPPTTGRIEIYQPATTLLSVGDNVDTAATALENSRGVADERGIDGSAFAAEVIEFAELAGFETAPLRTYSTGMLLRLSVALALCGRPALVLIDDVLAVGDISFQQKCVERLRQLRAQGTTLVIVSADPAVQQLATRIVTLAGGRVIADSAQSPGRGSVENTSGGDLQWRLVENLPEDEVVTLVALHATEDVAAATLNVTATFVTKMDGLRCRPFIQLDSSLAALFRSTYPEFLPADAHERLSFTVSVPTAALPGGVFTIGVHMVTLRGQALYSLKANDAITLTVRRPGAGEENEESQPELLPGLPWEVAEIAGAAVP